MLESQESDHSQRLLVGSLVQLPATSGFRPPPGIPHQTVTVQPEVSPNQRYNGNPNMPVQVSYNPAVYYFEFFINFEIFSDHKQCTSCFCSKSSRTADPRPKYYATTPASNGFDSKSRYIFYTKNFITPVSSDCGLSACTTETGRSADYASRSYTVSFQFSRLVANFAVLGAQVQ